MFLAQRKEELLLTDIIMLLAQGKEIFRNYNRYITRTLFEQCNEIIIITDIFYIGIILFVRSNRIFVTNILDRQQLYFVQGKEKKYYNS